MSSTATSPLLKPRWLMTSRTDLARCRIDLTLSCVETVFHHLAALLNSNLVIQYKAKHNNEISHVLFLLREAVSKKSCKISRSPWLAEQTDRVTAYFDLPRSPPTVPSVTVIYPLLWCS